MALAKFRNMKIKKTKRAFKFKLTTFYERIECEFQKGFEPNNLSIRWSRGNREVVSNTPSWTADFEDESAVKGRAKFEPVNAVELLITLYKYPKTVEYNDKYYKYSVEHTALNGKKTSLGVFELNVADYAEIGQHRHELALICKAASKKVFSMKIVMRLEVEFLKSGCAQDDDMISTWSALPGGETDYSDDEYNSDDGNDNRKRAMSTDLSYVLGESLFSLISKNREELVLPDGFPEDLSGMHHSKSIALLFSANWSDTCVNFLQTVDKLYTMREGRTFEIVYVSCDYDDESLIQGMKKHSIIYLSLRPKSVIAENLRDHYEVSSIPQLLIVNPETGRVIEREGKKVLEKCHGSIEEQKILATLWGKGKSSQSSHRLAVVKESILGSSVSLSSTLDGISESGQNYSKRKGSLKQQNTEQVIGHLEHMLKQKEQELRESQDQLQAAQEEILSLISENEALQAKNFEMSDQVRQLKIIVKDFGDQNRAMADEKQQLVAAMEVKGWLFKRGISGPTGRLWRKRYFQNNGFFLSYYKSPSTQVEQGSIDLKKVNEISILPKEKQDKNSASFNIITEQRVYELQARNPEEMSSWIRAVNYLMNYHKENMLQSYGNHCAMSPSRQLNIQNAADSIHI
ncbi:hypothetical protein LOD99_1214 [Oopsacas minuta]|uniref:PH domain-containing protein n=1 Tax=Oopsacas minuta TaxID=111878 RepID=A0AAV7K5V9_9METZ|nr:hypothetical protein LOD99_1214 [Oopsacas minuta]